MLLFLYCAFVTFVAFGARAALYAAGVSDEAAFLIATAVSTVAGVAMLAVVGTAHGKPQ